MLNDNKNQLIGHSVLSRFGALVTMNFLTLSPGEALYVPADGIYVYLSGDIVECMARSNNIINTGFCPPAERNSADIFTQVLSFKQHDPQDPILRRVKSEKSTNGKTTAVQSPMSEFNMLVSELQCGEHETVKAVTGPSIMIITSGKGQMKGVESRLALAREAFTSSARQLMSASRRTCKMG